MDKKILKNLLKLGLGILAILGAAALVRCQCIDWHSLTPASVRDYIQGFGRMAAVVYVLAYALNTISLIPPIAILSLTAGLAFGKVWGAVLLMTGAMLGTSATFLISRFFGRGFVERFLKGRLKNLDELLGRKGFATVFFFRVIPLVPYEVLNYAGGLSRIKFRDYFTATFLGIIPGVVISAFFGGTLGEVRGFKDLLTPKFMIALAALVLIILVPLIYSHFKKGTPKIDDKRF